MNPRHVPGGAATRLAWLVRLRWVAVAGQVVTITCVEEVLGVRLPLAWLFAVVGLTFSSNAALAWRTPATTAGAERLIGATLLLDTALLTALLWWSGGPSNPFGVLYLVHVTLAAVISSARWTWTTVVLSIAAYGFLFVSYRALPEALGSHGMHVARAYEATAPAAHAELHGHGSVVPPRRDAYSVHLQGMFFAFALTSCLVAWFVTRVSAALEQERLRAARATRLVGLSTLAAGAAHELATPLGSIKIAARELERSLASREGLEDALEDARLVRREVERGREVLDRLAASSGDPSGEPPERVRVAAVVDDIVAAVGSRHERVRVAVVDDQEVLVPRRSFARAIANLVDNALDASSPDQEVELSVGRAGGSICFAVRDRGCGMPQRVREHVGEPFFTTKPIGQGMGLGVYLARVLVEALGGTLEYTAERPGTVATLTIPLSKPRGET